MVQIKTLRNKKTGEKYSPRTHVKAVYDDNNNTLDSFLGVQDEKLSELEDKPISPSVGFAYFCSNKQTAEGGVEGIVIYHKGDNVWVDSLGRVVE